MEVAASSTALSRLAQSLRATLRLGLDTALPRLCPACRDLVTDQGVCPACWNKLAFISAPYCPRLGIPFAYDPGPGILSMEAIADPPAYGRARAAVRFDDVARDLVHALKYGDRLDLAATMGQWMARAGRDFASPGVRNTCTVTYAPGPQSADTGTSTSAPAAGTVMLRTIWTRSVSTSTSQRVPKPCWTQSSRAHQWGCHASGRWPGRTFQATGIASPR